MIVVLDGFSLNPGDLSWSGLENIGACKIYERTPADRIVLRAINAEILLTNKTPLNAGTLAALPGLRYVGVLATGYNVVDVLAARAKGIPVTNVPGYGTHSVAQHVFALILELTNHVGRHAASVDKGDWSRSADFCFWDRPLIELEGLTLGIIGGGRIGQAVKKIGEAFNMRVEVASRSQGAARLDEVFAMSDIVSLHCPLTEETKHMINSSRLARMKASAFLVNTARGPLVDENALADALNQGKIAGAALDVLSVEPPPQSNPLLGAKNCLITPHIAWATHAARARLLEVAVGNVSAFLEGKPRNVVN